MTEDPKPAADADKVKADAEKARAEAAKLLAEVETTKADAEKTRADTEKALADARSAATKASADERAEQEANSASARQQREATAQKATDEANRDAAAARRAQISALIPDVGTVKGGSLTVEGEAPFGPALVQRAVGNAAAKVTDDIVERVGGTPIILITSEEDLAASDAAYFEVVDGLDQLAQAAKALLDEIAKPAPLPSRMLATPLDVVAAVAGAVPGLLSLFSANRSMKTAAATISDLSASAATAGALKVKRPDWTIVHDDVRLLARGTVGTKLDALNLRRQELTGRKLALEDHRTRTASALADKRAEEATAKAKLEKAAEADKAQAAADLKELSAEVEKLDLAIAADALRIGLLDSMSAAIDTFTSELMKAPDGGSRSPYVRAMLRQGLHGDTPKFTHVLLVKGAGGSTTQTVDDKPLFFEDKLSVIATVAITYVLLQVSDSAILAAGSSGSSATMFGKLGEMFQTLVENRVP